MTNPQTHYLVGPSGTMQVSPGLALPPVAGVFWAAGRLLLSRLPQALGGTDHRDNKPTKYPAVIHPMNQTATQQSRDILPDGKGGVMTDPQKHYPADPSGMTQVSPDLARPPAAGVFWAVGGLFLSRLPQISGGTHQQDDKPTKKSTVRHSINQTKTHQSRDILPEVISKKPPLWEGRGPSGRTDCQVYTAEWADETNRAPTRGGRHQQYAGHASRHQKCAQAGPRPAAGKRSSPYLRAEARKGVPPNHSMTRPEQRLKSTPDPFVYRVVRHYLAVIRREVRRCRHAR